MEKIAAQTFNQSGKTISSPINFSNNGLTSDKLIAKLSDTYYRNLNQFPSSENNYTIGFGPFVAVTETVAASALVWCFRSIATGMNLLMTLLEFGQAWNASIDPNKILEKDEASVLDESQRRKKLEESIAAKESGMAWFQLFAGGGGVLGMMWEYLSGKNEENIAKVPFLKKLILSASSAMNVLFMLAGAQEKSLMSMLSWNGGGKGGEGQDYRSMIINGNSDMRGATEWGIMTIVPWVSNISFIKQFVDAAVVYGAIREGLEYFGEEGRMALTIGKKKLIDIDLNETSAFSRFIKFFVNPFSFIRKGTGSDDEGARYRLCWPFNKALGFLLGFENDVGGPGTSGFRNKFIAPLLKNVFGCNPFNAYLDDHRNIVCEFVEELKPEAVVTKNPGSQILRNDDLIDTIDTNSVSPRTIVAAAN